MTDSTNIDISPDTVEAIIRRGDEFFRYWDNRDRAVAMLRALRAALTEAQEHRARMEKLATPSEFVLDRNRQLQRDLAAEKAKHSELRDATEGTIFELKARVADLEARLK